MFAPINGLNLYYEDRGAGEAEPILFLHGFPLDHRMWRHQVEFLAPARRCLAPDLRGHGQTTDAGAPLQPGQVSFDLMADDLAALLDRLGVGTCAVCGLSMGGYIAFALWRQHARRISRLIFVDTKASPDSPEARAGRYKMADLVTARGARAAADAMLPRLVAPEHLSDEVGQDIRRTIEQTAPAHIVNTLAALAERPDSTGLLPALTVPSLVIVGEKDVITPLDDARLLHTAAPQSRGLVVIPGAGHMSPMENPLPVSQAIATFLQT